MSENLKRKTMIAKNTSRLRTTLILLYILIAICVGAVFALVTYLAINDILETLYIILLFIGFFLFIASITSAFVVYYKYIQSINKLTLFTKFYSFGDFIYDQSKFEKIVAHRIYKRKKQSAIVVFTIKNFKEEIVSNSNKLYISNLLSIIARRLHTDFGNHSKYVYGFDYNEVFLIYGEFDNLQEFITDVKNMISNIENEVQSKNAIYYPEFVLGGIVVDDSNDKIKTDMLISLAETAAYRNMDTITFNEIIFYDKNIDGNDFDFANIDSEIISGLQKEEFEIYYQPQYDLIHERFIGAEALIRWHHPRRGILSPGLFISQAEKSGRIVDIDKYVFKKVCEDIAGWTKSGFRLLPISVNLSRRSTYYSFIFDYISETMASYNINPLMIKIELTESFASKNVIFTEHIMKKIKALNIKVCLDDVGTGYSSLSVLKNLPLDVSKLDKSFFDDIEIDKKARDVIEALVKLCHDLGMYVIGEGIQNQKQITIVKKLRVDCVQGYFYSKPLPKRLYEAFLTSNKFEVISKKKEDTIK